MKENNIYQSCTITVKHRHRRWVQRNKSLEGHMQQKVYCYVCEHQGLCTLSSRTWQRISFKSLCFINSDQTVST